MPGDVLNKVAGVKVRWHGTKNDEKEEMGFAGVPRYLYAVSSDDLPTAGGEDHTRTRGSGAKEPKKEVDRG